MGICVATADTVLEKGLGCDSKDERNVCRTTKEKAARRRARWQEEEERSCATKVSFFTFCFSSPFLVVANSDKWKSVNLGLRMPI